MFDNYAKPVLKKESVMKEIAEFLNLNPKTQIESIRGEIKGRLRSQGIIGPQEKYQGGGVYRYDVRISSEDALLINECIYDLLYSRILTPGVNSDNLELPHVHVSDFEKLKSYL